MSHSCCERAFRRAAHQVLELAVQLAEQGITTKGIRSRLICAADVASELRTDHEWSGALVDEINSRVQARFTRRQPSNLLEDPEPFHCV
jgi:hypothetical protein